MLKHETAFELFHRLHIKDEPQHRAIIDRLNRYHEILFPNGFHNQGQIIELLDDHRMTTKRFLHGFISDSIEYMNYSKELKWLPIRSEDILSASPRANSHSVDLQKTIAPMKIHHNELITFFYFDTEYKTCPFNSEFIQWYDCETSTQLISTLLRLEQSCFMINPNRRFILIIDSSTQIPVNDYFNLTTYTHVMSIEENRLLAVQWHKVLCDLVMKYKLACILVEHLDVETPIFDTLIVKHDEKLIHQKRLLKDTQVSFSEFAFGRLMIKEHYIYDWNNLIEYRQIHDNDMSSVHYE